MNTPLIQSDFNFETGTNMVQNQPDGNDPERVQRKGYPGLFIVLEGIDGAGKTTLAERLSQRLHELGQDTLLTFEPTQGRWGKRLRESFTGTRLSPEEELNLFLLDRQEHLDKEIIPALQQGNVVLCDRYYYSTAAYQGAIGLDPDKIMKQNRKIAVRPDIVIFLQIDPEQALKRIIKGRKKANSFEKLDYLQRVAELYERILHEEENSGRNGARIIRIDASLPQEEILSMALKTILCHLNTARHQS